ncbi:RNA polymerase sigma factor [Streptacidiphilus pinicola]|uniref:RNA polymerase sigma factor n=1 Tax=Streptacidiphilus pinicola TaxID=2219663 RepID=UPI001FB387AD|nr:sigma-70 family RNA polymerase sigma factor [Streptacidiphilus pinicola]
MAAHRRGALPRPGPERGGWRPRGGRDHGPGDLPDRPTATPGVADTVEARSREGYVLALLDTLPPRPRAVLCLHLEGLGTAEIAAELGLEQPAVRQNLSRARRALRALISEGDDREH